MARPIRSAGVRRLLQEAQELEADDCADYAAQPLEDDIFQWHFTLRGAEGSDYQGGIYHGKLVLPSDYPFKPPEVYMLTASGRFEVNKKICLSISSFHPETWQPSWGIRTALLAIMAFFETEPKGAVGSLDAPPAERRRLAVASKTHKCATCGFDASDDRSFAALPAAAAAKRGGKTGDTTKDTQSVTEVEAAPVELAPGATPSEASSSAASPAQPDFVDDSDAEGESATPTNAHADSDPPTAIFPSAASPPARTPPAPRSSSSSGRTPRGPPSPAAPLQDAHGSTSANPLVPPGAPRLSPAHLPPRARAALEPPALGNGAHHDLPALPPGLSLAQLSSGGLPVGGGPPSWIDRAIVACLLAIVALIVRKVA